MLFVLARRILPIYFAPPNHHFYFMISLSLASLFYFSKQPVTVYISAVTAGTGANIANHQDVAVDSSGNIYVADSGNNRILVFSKIGTFITNWGAYGISNAILTRPNSKTG